MVSTHRACIAESWAATVTGIGTTTGGVTTTAGTRDEPAHAPLPARAATAKKINCRRRIRYRGLSALSYDRRPIPFQTHGLRLVCPAGRAVALPLHRGGQQEVPV